MAHLSTCLRIAASVGALASLGSLLSAAPQEPAAAPAPAARAVPFLYSIDRKRATPFLYGTVHLPDERVIDVPQVVVGAFDASDVFYAEIEATAASEQKVQSLAMMKDGASLDQLLGAEVWGRIEARFTKAGLPPGTAKAMGRFEPWAFSALLPMLDYFQQMMTQPALDKVLYQRAEKAGKVVGGLETVEEQVAVFSTFSREEQVGMLKDSLQLLEEYEAQGRNVMEEMVLAWLSGDSDTLVKLLDDGFGSDPVLRERAEAELLWKRNERFATRIDGKLMGAMDKTQFFAVGSLHLPDAPVPVPETKEGEAAPTQKAKTGAARKLGLVTLLEEKGYTVTRIKGRVRTPQGAVK